MSASPSREASPEPASVATVSANPDPAQGAAGTTHAPVRPLPAKEFGKHVLSIAKACVASRTLFDIPRAVKAKDVAFVMLTLLGHKLTYPHPVQLSTSSISAIIEKLCTVNLVASAPLPPADAKGNLLFHPSAPPQKPRLKKAKRRVEARTMHEPRQEPEDDSQSDSGSSGATPERTALADPTAPAPQNLQSGEQVSPSAACAALLHLPASYAALPPRQQSLSVRAAMHAQLDAHERKLGARELPAWILELDGDDLLTAAGSYTHALKALLPLTPAKAQTAPAKVGKRKRRLARQGMSASCNSSDCSEDEDEVAPAPKMPLDMAKHIPLFSGGSSHVGALPMEQFMPMMSWFDNARYKLTTCGASEVAAVRFLVNRLTGTALHHFRQHTGQRSKLPRSLYDLRCILVGMFDSAREYFTQKVSSFNIKNQSSAIADLQKFLDIVECSSFDSVTQLTHLQSRVRTLISAVYPHLLSDALTWGSAFKLPESLVFRDYVMRVIQIVQSQHARVPPKTGAMSNGKSAPLPDTSKSHKLPRPGNGSASASSHSKDKSAKPSAASTGDKFKADVLEAKSGDKTRVNTFLGKYERCTACGSRTFPDKPHACPPQAERDERKRTRIEGMVKSMEKGYHPNAMPKKHKTG